MYFYYLQIFFIFIKYKRKLMNGGNALKQLVDLREQSNLQAIDLAKMCGVTRQHISNIEHDKVKPSVPLAKKFGRIFGVDWKIFYED